MFSLFKKRTIAQKLYLFNTKTKQKEEFEPINKVVSIYSCGPTVYNYAHLGNLRSYVFRDILKRVLIYSGHKVKDVINITDVGHLVSDADEGEDRLEKAVRREGKTAQVIAAFYTKEFLDDVKDLNIDTNKTLFPKATEYISEQIDLVKKLEEKKLTYKTTDGIYFDTSKFKNYGILGGIDLEGLKEGARVEINREKKNPTDFAIWKFSKEEEKRQQEWDSPWGKGFPGWHLECSAMAMKLLGEQIDIHTGGIDHIPIHHNNEIAQSESVTNKEFARFWLHNQFLNVESGKMAKSKENFLRLQTVVDRNINPLSYRYFLLQAHYRSPLTFSWEALEASQTALRRLSEQAQALPKGGSVSDEYKQKFESYISDDLDTPGALALVWTLVKDDSLQDTDKRATLINFDKILGLDLFNISFEKTIVIPEEIRRLAKEREEARKAKDWQKADHTREEIEKLGFVIKDIESGFKIEKK